MSVTVEQIDQTAPSVTVKTPRGNSMTFHVNNPSNIQNLKVGDQVDISYTEGLLVRVDPAAK